MAHGTNFLKMEKTSGAYSLQIYDYLSQVQRKAKAFLLIVRHNTEGQPISDWYSNGTARSFSSSDRRIKST